MCSANLKKILIFTLSLLFLLCSPSQAIASNSDNSLSAEEKFIAFKERITHDALNASNYRAPEVKTQITDALVQTRKFHKKVEKAKKIEQVEELLGSNIDKLAETYENTASLGEEMLRKRTDELNDIAYVGSQIQLEIDSIKKKLSKLDSESTDFRKALNKGNLDSTTSAKMAVTLKGNESLISSLESQDRIWSKLRDEREILSKEMRKNSEKLDLLVHIISVNSDVYKEASNTSHLMSTDQEKIEGLAGLANVQGITDELQNDWSQVNSLITTLQETDFSE